ncbi:MAG: hypothetical protein HC904_09740 [Blastochloris sp.]|nr:hypothetical protein [Blastochloris sp.]
MWLWFIFHRRSCQIGSKGTTRLFNYLGDFSIFEAIIIPGVMAFFITFYTAFFAIHAAQHIQDPCDRSGWLLIIVPFTVFGATFYFMTKYLKFKSIGKGNLIINNRKRTLKDFLVLTESEKSLPNQDIDQIKV